MSEEKRRVSSPCISICALNKDDVCVGCYRTADEIRDWVMMADDERIKVIDKSMQRAQASNPFA